MKKLLLIPTLAATLSPLVCLTNCGGGGWVEWDFVKNGKFTKEIEKAPEIESPTVEKCNNAYFDWLSKDKNNFVYDYFLSFSEAWVEDIFDVANLKIKVTNIDYEKHLISYQYKIDLHGKIFGETIEANADIECKNIQYSFVPYNDFDGNRYWKFGSIITTFDARIARHIISLVQQIQDDQNWELSGDIHMNNTEAPIDLKDFKYNYEDARQIVKDADQDAAVTLVSIYDTINFKSIYMEDVALPPTI